MAKIIIEFSDSYLDWFSNTIDVFTSICQHCPDVKKSISAGDVVKYTMIAGPHVTKSFEGCVLESNKNPES